MGYHLNVGIVSRGKGQSVVAKAAYNSREKIIEERTGETKDYRYKDAPEWSGIFAGQDAPAWAQDRAQLWNAADRAEKRKDAQLAYNYIAALPHQLSGRQREFMVKDFAREQFMRRGVVADAHIHAPDPKGDDRNHHVHMLVTMREVTPEGFGKRVLEWKDREQNLERWREKWAERGARELEKAGFQVEADRWRVGHLDLERQRQAALERGDLAHAETLNRKATKHRGPQVDAMERKGPETERGNAYRDTIEHNNTVVGLKAELAEVDRQIAAEAAYRRQQEFREAAVQAGADSRMANEFNQVAADIRTARQYSDSPKAFAAALAEKNLYVARVTKDEARAGIVGLARTDYGGLYSQALREGEYVVVTEQWRSYRLTPQATGENFQDTQKFMAMSDPKAVQGVDATKQAIQERGELREIERQAFRDLSSVGLLKRDDDPPSEKARERRAMADELRNKADRIARPETERGKIDPDRFRLDSAYRQEVKSRITEKTKPERQRHSDPPSRGRQR